MFVSFYTELGNSSIADERVFLLHFILQQGKVYQLTAAGREILTLETERIRKLALLAKTHHL